MFSSQPFLSGALAFAICAAALPVSKRIAVAWGLYDQPGQLKIHHQPIPRIGGVAMMMGVLSCLLPVVVQHTDRYGFALLSIAAVWMVGLIDDVRSLPAAIRLMVHLASGAFLWMGGWQLHWASNRILDCALTALFVAFLINAFNLLDGLDGLAAGTTVVATAGFLILPADSFSQLVAYSLMGVCLGVLLLNFPPADIFMGDSGSTLIGILLAILFLNWIRLRPDSHDALSPLFFIGLPLSDAFLAILRRIRGGASPFAGDRRHFYDLLVQRGWSVYRVLLAAVGVTCLLVLVGWLRYEEQGASGIVLVLVVTSMLFVSHLLGSLRSSVTRGHSQQQTASLNSIG